MPNLSTCIKVPKTQGEATISLANESKILNKQLEIRRTGSFLYIPVFKNLHKKC